MTPSAWIALASFAGFLLLQTGVVAFALGRLFQKVQTLEKGNDAISGLSTAFARMDEKMGHVVNSVDDLKNKLAWATEVPSHSPRRRQQQNSPKGGQQ